MKKAVLFTTTLMHCKVKQILRDLFSTNQGSGSEIQFVAGVTEINLAMIGGLDVSNNLKASII